MAIFGVPFSISVRYLYTRVLTQKLVQLCDLTFCRLNGQSCVSSFHKDAALAQKLKLMIDQVFFFNSCESSKYTRKKNIKKNDAVDHRGGTIYGSLIKFISQILPFILANYAYNDVFRSKQPFLFPSIPVTK